MILAQYSIVINYPEHTIFLAVRRPWEVCSKKSKNCIYNGIKRLCLSAIMISSISSSGLIEGAIISSFPKTFSADLNIPFTVSTKMGVVRKLGRLPPTSSWRMYSTSKLSGPVGWRVVANKWLLALVWRGISSGNKWLCHSSNSVHQMTVRLFGHLTTTNVKLYARCRWFKSLPLRCCNWCNKETTRAT